jgi:hypothetical protein
MSLTEHPDVAAIEQMLTAAAERSPATVSTRSGKVVADRAVWFCACSTDAGMDAPTWLIYETADGNLGWRRIPLGLDVPDLVEAAEMAGDHVEPEAVLGWLEGADERVWPGDDEAGRAIIADLGRRIRALLV